jgi:hypothetical protein
LEIYTKIVPTKENDHVVQDDGRHHSHKMRGMGIQQGGKDKSNDLASRRDGKHSDDGDDVFEQHDVYSAYAPVLWKSCERKRNRMRGLLLAF